MNVTEMNVYQLDRLEAAMELIAETEFPTDNYYQHIDARRRELQALLDWLNAERQWGNRVREWLSAEASHRRKIEQFESPFYSAGAAGWAALKVLTPALDGVNLFSELPPSLQYRYAAFARGVYDAALDPKVVLSKMQKEGRTSLPTLPNIQEIAE